MKTRLELQELLQNLLGTNHVYYQPPENLKIEYPAIRYSKEDVFSNKANNKKYCKYTIYDIVVLDKKPDNKVIDKILDLPYTEFDRHYVSDGLHHDIIRIYF